MSQYLEFLRYFVMCKVYRDEVVSKAMTIMFVHLYKGDRENTMLMSFDNKFIRRDQTQRKNGEA